MELKKYPIWDQRASYPAQQDMNAPRGIERFIAHDAREDLLPFLHDVAITTYQDVLYQAWYNSTDAEIYGSSVIRGRHSRDGGQTWSEPYFIAGAINISEEHYVPISFFPQEDALYALITEMEGKNMTLTLDLYRQRDNPLAPWEKVANVGGGFISNAPPVLMEDGNYILGVWMPMKGETPAFPAVLISQGRDIRKPWNCHFIYDPIRPGALDIRCPEISLWAEGERITAFVRNDEGPSYIFVSSDFGRTWEAYENPMDIGNSKIFAGKLSDGRKYIVYNAERDYFVRSLLCIALTEPGESQLSRVYKLFEDAEPEIGRSGGWWFYPCACEYEGHLYVACTLLERPSELRSSVIARIPVETL